MKKLLLGFIFFTCIISKSQVNLTSSLAACYALNGSGTEPINNLTGTLSSVTSTLDRFNNPNSALMFNGTIQSYIALPDNPLLKPSNAISFSSWVKPTSLNANQYVLFTKNNTFSNFESYALAIASGFGGYKFRGEKGNGLGGTNQADCVTTLSVNTWYHIVLTIDNSFMKLYLNGVLENSISLTINSFNYQAGKKVYLGGSNEPSFNLPFFGVMDNTRFYNRVINAAEVYELFTQDPSCMPAIGLPPVASFTSSAIQVCAGSTLALSDLSSNSPTSWNWLLTGPSTVSSAVSSPVFSLNIPGNYTVSLVSSNVAGASNTATQSILVLPNPTITLAPSNTVLCLGQNVTLTASGANSYTWSNNQTGASITVNIAAINTISVAGTGTSGCVSTSSITLQGATLPIVNIFASDTLICSGDSVMLSASGANTYFWSNLQGGASILITPTASAIYSVSGTNASGCSSGATVGVVVAPLPAVTVASTKSIICRGENVILTASGAISYFWSTSQTSTNIQVTPAVNTIYSVSGTNASGCSASATVGIIVKPLPVISAMSSRSVICRGEKVILIANGGLSYIWSNSLNTPTIQIAPASSSVYTVTGFDASGCKGTAFVNLIVSECTQLLNGNSNYHYFKVYPNPSKGILIVELLREETGFVTIFNSLGYLVLSKEFVDNEKVFVDFQNESNGLYFVNIKIGENIYTTKIIKD